MAKREHRLQIPLNEQELLGFRKYAKRKQLPMAEILRDFIKDKIKSDR